MQPDSEGRSEVVLMEIEGRDGGRLGGRDGDEGFELQPLFALAVGHQFAAAPEKGVGGEIEFRVQTDDFENLGGANLPCLAPGQDFVSFANAHQLALMKGLHAGQIVGRLVAENVAGPRSSLTPPSGSGRARRWRDTTDSRRRAPEPRPSESA